MSDTPRTDSQAKFDWGELVDSAPEFVSADFARQLERELAACRRDAERMKICIDEIRDMTGISPELQKGNPVLLTVIIGNAHQMADAALDREGK